MYNVFSFFSETIGIIICVVYLLAISMLTSWLAVQKGYSAGAWFFLGLFFNFFALMALGFAPNKTSTEIKLLDDIKRNLKMASGNSSSPTNDNPASLKTNYTGDTWTCKQCNNKNPRIADYCNDCGVYK